MTGSLMPPRKLHENQTDSVGMTADGEYAELLPRPTVRDGFALSRAGLPAIWSATVPVKYLS